MAQYVLGAVQFGLNYGINNKSGQTPASEVEKLLELAWQNGIKEIDTAQAYGSSEIILGECLRESQNEFVVHSKFVTTDLSIQEAIKVSLEHLHIKKLGYFYFHKFSDYLTYRSLKPQGEPLHQTLGLAVSAYDESELSIAVNDSFIKAIQVPLNIFDSSEEKIELIKKARENGQKIYVRSVFLQGLFFMDPQKLPEKLKIFSKPLEDLLRVSRTHELSLKSLALGFVNTIANVDGILIGVETVSQLEDNLKVAHLKLSEEIMQELKLIQVFDRKMLLPKNWD